MHKHRSKNRRKPHFVNQNTELSPSTSELIYSIVDRINGSDYASSYLRSSYLSKYADPDPDQLALRRSAAIAKWMATEEHNKRTNHRLAMLDRDFNVLPRVTFKRFIKHARHLVSQILRDLHDDIIVGGFSGGATTGHRRTRAHPGFKFTDKAEVSYDAEYLIDPLWHQCPLLRQYMIFSRPQVVEGAVLFTVPKNSDIERCACKEPELNMFLQKGVGKYIRSRLRKFGVNLNDQSVNRDLARLGSSDGNLATLDLSSASDTISIAIVRLLLPSDWFDYLNDIRSRRVWVDGTLVTTEMFSSMGNGFTFELESLLFYVLARTTLYFEGISGRVSVYGDDIIIPSKGYSAIVWILNLFGFKINEDKSFSDGFFRESCGGHYFHGHDVTPFYLKRPAVQLTDLIRVANQLRKWACATQPIVGGLIFADSSVFTEWNKLKSLVPSDLWGGSDMDSDTQLVTADRPNKRLTRVKRVNRVPSKGLYVFWQNTTWDRRDPPKEASSNPSATDSVCRKRPAINHSEPFTGPYFFMEYFPESGLG